MTEKPTLKGSDRIKLSNNTIREFARPGELREQTVERAFYHVLDALVQAGWDAAVEAMTPAYKGPVRLTNGDQTLYGKQEVINGQKVITLPSLMEGGSIFRQTLEKKGWAIEEVDA